MRRIAIGAALALGLTLGGVSTAFAGEYNGQGVPIVRGGPSEHGGHPASECSFSGQDQSDSIEDNGPNGEGNDDFVTVPGKSTTPNPSGHRVQNWGQYVVAFGGGKGSGVPGQACRGNQ